ncbi:MAG TPA: hypothetical protein EYN51_11820, partial [Flavobacteriales bacterium]|nr:hypothetical protein [Flavobacteriales bacterium]
MTSDITIIENFGPSIEIVSLSIDSIPLLLDTIGNQLTIFIPNFLFPNGELLPQATITITECLILTECTQGFSGNSQFYYSWECNGQACQGDSVSADAKVPLLNQIDLQFSPGLVNPTDVCYGPDNSSMTQLIVSNNGLAPALNCSLQLDGGALSAIDDTNFVYVNVAGDTVAAPLTAFAYLDTSLGFCNPAGLEFAYFGLGDIGPSESLVLLWNTTTCCPSGTVCGSGAGRNFNFDFQYLDQCLADTDTIVLNNQGVFSQTANTDISWLSGPIQLLGDTTCASVDTGDYTFVNSDILRLWSGDSSSSAIQVNFNLDPGLYYDNVGGQSLAFISNTITWLPDSIDDDIDPLQGGGTVSAWFPLPLPVDFTWSTATYHIRVFGLCPAPSAGTLELEVLYLPTREASCSTLCPISLACYAIPVSIQCCGCDRHGTENTSYDISRVNLDGPDNDNNGVDDGGGTVTPPIPNLAMQGDTLEAVASAFVQPLQYPQPFDDSWFRFGYYSHTISNNTCRNALTPLDAFVEIYDADTTDAGCSTCDATYGFTIPGNTVVFNGPEWIYDFSIDQIPLYGGTPTSDRFGFGDVITVSPRFLVEDNVGPVELDCFTAPNGIFLGIAAFPTCEDPTGISFGKCEPDSFGVNICGLDTVSQCDGRVRYQCTKQNGVFKLIGNSFNSNASISFGCPSSISVSNSINFGKTTKSNYFENEYRHFGITDTAVINIPPGFIFDFVRISHSRLNGTTSVTHTIDSITPDSIGGDTTLYFSLSQYYDISASAACSVNCTTTELYPGDEESGFSVTVFFHPTCSTLTDTLNLFPFIGFAPNFVPDSGQFDRSPGFPQGTVVYTAPEFFVNDGLHNVDGVTREVCWPGWELQNQGGIATNFWMTGSSPSGNVQITNIFDGSTFAPDSNGIFQVGTFDAGDAKAFTICAQYACDTLLEDSIIVYYGWNCPEYPTSLADYPCDPDSFVLHLRPKLSILQDSVTLSANSMNICDTLQVDVSVNVAGTGNVYDIVMETEIIGGTFIDTTSATLTYPDSTNIQAVSVPTPVGNLYTWDINSLSPFFAANGLPGDGFTTVDDSTEFTISFDLVGNCSLERENEVITNVSGIKNCGDPTSTNTIISTFTINNYPSPVPKDLFLSSTDFRSCDSIATVTVEIIHTDSLELTDTSDLFKIILPPCVEFVTGSFINIIQGPFNPVPDTIGNLLTWNLLPGVSADTNNNVMIFQFEIQVTDSTCSSSYLLEGNTTVPDSLLCDIDTLTNDSNFCQLNIPAASDITFSELPEPLAAFISFTDALCFGDSNGTATIDSITGGNAPYLVYWTTLGGDTLDTLLTVDSLPSDTFVVTVIGQDSCVVINTVFISQPLLLTIQLDSLAGASCLLSLGPCDGSAAVSVTGGILPYAFLWGNGETGDTATALCANINFITVTDSNGCAISDTITIAEPDPAFTGSLTFTNASCNGLCDATASITFSGGAPPYQVNLWQNNGVPIGSVDTVIGNLCAGYVFLLAQDSNGCSLLQNISIPEPDSLIATITNTVDATCNSANGPCDGSASVTATGGTPPYNYLWDDPAAQVDSTAINLCQGTYNVLVTDSSGCDTSTGVTINEPTAISFTLATIDATCSDTSDGEVTINASGGTPPYVYTINSVGSQVTPFFTGLTPNNYVLGIEDSLGCFTTGTFTIGPPLIVVTLSNVDSASSCISNDGTATVNVTGGTPPYNYLWSNGETTFTATALPVGTSTVIITDANGCTTTRS